jgi:hypothetical protein
VPEAILEPWATTRRLSWPGSGRSRHNIAKETNTSPARSNLQAVAAGVLGLAPDEAPAWLQSSDRISVVFIRLRPTPRR